MPGWASPWLWTAETWAGLQFFVLCAAAIVAYRQVREARRLREEQTRPFVIVDVEPDDFIFMIVVSNTGPSMARDVRIKIEPPLTSSIKEQELSKLKMFREPIPSLAPGRIIRTILDSSISRDMEAYPDVYNVRVKYSDETGRRFDESQVIDLGLYWETSEIRRKTVHDAVKQLDAIANEIGKWGSSVTGGLLVVTPDERRSAIEKRREEHRRKADEASGSD